jgi:hypothetical protein
VTDELRALLRAELQAERPPPLTDLVAAAIRDGRRIRRRRRLGAFGAGAAVAGMVAAAVATTGGVAASPRPAVPPAAAVPYALTPGSVPPSTATPIALPTPRTLTIHSGTQRAEGLQKKATSAAMLLLLTTLLPPGRTSHYGVSADNELHVQLYLDDGTGPAMVRLSVGRSPTGKARGGTAAVTVIRDPGNCVQDTVVGAAWPDGTAVQVDVATCLAWDGVRNQPARRALSQKQAVAIAADPRWSVTMSAKLLALGAAKFPDPLPVFS